jgi:hypothetical protein
VQRLEPEHGDLAICRPVAVVSESGKDLLAALVLALSIGAAELTATTSRLAPSTTIVAFGFARKL